MTARKTQAPEEVTVPRARSLEDMVAIFDPIQALSGATMAYYAKRPDSPIRRMEKLLHLRRGKTAVKMLFAGHRGSGKTTELLRLCDHLKDDFFVAYMDADDKADVNDLSYVELLYIIVTELVQAANAARPKIKISRGTWKHLKEWMEAINPEGVTPSVEMDELGVEINLGLIKLESQLKLEPRTREIIRERVERRITDFIAIINELVDELAARCAKEVLVVIDSLDRMTLEKARILFYGNTERLLAPKCHLLYTVPLAIIYTNEFGQIEGSFDHYMIPNVKTKHDVGGMLRRYEEGYNMLRQVVTNRLDATVGLKLITEESLDRAVEMSGGLLRQLVRFIENASLEAALEGASAVEKRHVETAVSERRNDFRRILTPEQRVALKEYHRTRTLDNREVTQDLLHNMSLLEYCNDEGWCDVNPVVVKLLEKEIVT